MVSYLWRALAWTAAGLLALRWPTLTTAPFAAAQERLVSWYGAPSSALIQVTASCSGSDVLVVCCAAVLAFPAPWGRRLLAAACVATVVTLANVVRLWMLLHAAPDPEWLALLHDVIWPAGLVGVAGAAVLGAAIGLRGRRRIFSHRSGWIVSSLVLAHFVLAPWTTTSAWTQDAARVVASGAGVVLTAAGAEVEVRAADAMLITARGAFVVTGECVVTPVWPLFLAMVLVVPISWRQRAAVLVAGVPMFFALAVLRASLTGVPADILAVPDVAVHAFFQILVAAAAIVAVGWPARSWSKRAGALVVAGVVMAVAGMVSRDVLSPIIGAWDAQGAVGMVPGFQWGLLAGLLVAAGAVWHRRSVVWAVSALAVTQGVLVWLVHGEVPVVIVRLVALGVPMAIYWVAVHPRVVGDAYGSKRYLRFWQKVGGQFPDLRGALSTTLYATNEQQLLQRALPSLRGCRLLKTDLWDEARNTRILHWAAGQGAVAHGIDLSQPIAEAAATPSIAGRVAIADVRAIPFATGAFDAVYSMGTVEHFTETEAAICEIARVLAPGGRVILGVPNRHDPFLRPLLVSALSAVGLYGYGFEKSYTRRQLRRMMERAGLDVVEETGILFIPGWLRMAELACHAWCPAAGRLLRPAVRVFIWLDQRYPALRRHGYLLASVGVKRGHAPATPGPSATRV